MYQILSQVKRLRQSAKFKNVFVRPDRSEEERASDRLLVQELLNKREAEPGKCYTLEQGQSTQGTKQQSDAYFVATVFVLYEDDFLHL